MRPRVRCLMGSVAHKPRLTGPVAHAPRPVTGPGMGRVAHEPG
jgi:hypothetical protein